MSDNELQVERFLEMLSAERGAARNTLDSYRRDLTHFGEFLAGPLAQATDEDIRDYLARLHQDGMATTTAARRLSALRQFYRFLYAEGIRTDDPTATVDSPRRERPLPKLLSEAEVDALLRAAREVGDSAEGRRLVCLMEVLYATGMRVSELVTLPLAAAATDRPTLVVKGKGGRERVVPLSEPAREALTAYREIRGRFVRRPIDDKWLFPSRSRGGHLTRQRFSQLLKELAQAANIDTTKVSPHTLRHAFASHMLAHGADLRVVQKMLGHADISTTQIYTHVLKDRMSRLVRENHPLRGSESD